MASIINRKFRYTYSNAVMLLIALNIVIFAVAYLVIPSLRFYLSMIPSQILYKHWYWQFASYMFMHGNMWHLLFNMLGLFMFGTPVERTIGTREFLLFYFLTGILSGIASYFCYYFQGHNVMLMGALGAIYAVMLLFSLFFPNAVIFVFGFIPVRAPLLILIYFVMEFFGQFRISGTAHATHLFGLLVALLYAIIRMKINPFDAWRGQRY